MRALPVAVPGIGPERPIEMPPTEDEGPVEALGPDRVDHALGVGIDVGSPGWASRSPGPLPNEPPRRTTG
jgi:hypothetical protein